MRIFIIVGVDERPIGFAFVDERMATSCLREANETNPPAAPHRVVAFVPEVR